MSWYCRRSQTVRTWLLAGGALCVFSLLSAEVLLSDQSQPALAAESPKVSPQPVTQLQVRPPEPRLEAGRVRGSASVDSSSSPTQPPGTLAPQRSVLVQDNNAVTPGFAPPTSQGNFTQPQTVIPRIQPSPAAGLTADELREIIRLRELFGSPLNGTSLNSLAPIPEIDGNRPAYPSPQESFEATLQRVAERAPQNLHPIPYVPTPQLNTDQVLPNYVPASNATPTAQRIEHSCHELEQAAHQLEQQGRVADADQLRKHIRQIRSLKRKLSEA